MKFRQHFCGFLLLVVLAGLGTLLVYLPTVIAEQYERVQQWGQTATYAYFVSIGLGTALIVGVALSILFRLWRKSRAKRLRKELRDRNPSELTSVQQLQEIDENLSEAHDLRSDSSVAEDLRQELDPLVQQVEEKRESQSLEIAAFGTISSGKSSLLNALVGRDVFVTDARGGTTVQRNELPWPGQDKIVLVDTPGLGEVEGSQRGTVAGEAAKDADLVLLVVDGPLRDSEHRLLEVLGGMEKRVLVCLNKEDWYEEEERTELLGQITTQVAPLVHEDDVLAVRSRPTRHQRIRVLPDGTESDETLDVPPDISSLAERMICIIDHERQHLLLANLLMQSRGLVEQARQRVRQSLDRRAWAVVDRHMWGSGGAAALSPFPVVDLVAGAAVSTRMVLELARVYRHDVDQETAVRWLAELGKHLLGLLGGVAATAFVGSLLKTVPAAGWVVGGLMQGFSQALITRWIGSVFIEYFGDEMNEPEGGLAGLARRQWEKITTVQELHKLVHSARRHLGG